jgi:hypothetical protein
MSIHELKAFFDKKQQDVSKESRGGTSYVTATHRRNSKPPIIEERCLPEPMITSKRTESPVRGLMERKIQYFQKEEDALLERKREESTVTMVKKGPSLNEPAERLPPYGLPRVRPILPPKPSHLKAAPLSSTSREVSHQVSPMKGKKPPLLPHSPPPPIPKERKVPIVRHPSSFWKVKKDHRMPILQEWLSTEMCYVKDLQLILDYIVRPMKEESGREEFELLVPFEQKLLFSNIESVYDLAVFLLEQWKLAEKEEQRTKRLI